MFLAISVLITTCLIVPALGVIQNYSGVPASAAFSQYLGLVALMGMAFCHIIATRIKLVETLFGGLDKSYFFHKWLGISSLIAIFLHDQIDPKIKGLGGTWLSHLAKELGGYSFDGLQVLLLITVVILIPYALWKFTHKFIGIFFIVAALHFIWIPKPFALSSPLSLYILSFCGLGVFSYLYTLRSSFTRLFKFSNILKGTLPYKVTSKEQTGDITCFELSPVKKAIRYKAGQFAFISFAHEKLTESHPFTISKAPSADGSLRFSIKALGDYTQELHKYLEPGLLADVSNGYGHFAKTCNKNNEIWIAAGIGITPFIAMAQALPDRKAADKKEVHLFYCFHSEINAVHRAELEALTKEKTYFHVHFCDSAQGSLITLPMIKKATGFDLKQSSISFCGPTKMRKMLQQWFKNESVPARHFHYEIFELRSGIGLDPIIQWALNILLMRFPKIRQVWAKLPF